MKDQKKLKEILKRSNGRDVQGGSSMETQEKLKCLQEGDDNTASVWWPKRKKRKSDSGFRSGRADFEPPHNSFSDVI